MGRTRLTTSSLQPDTFLSRHGWWLGCAAGVALVGLGLADGQYAMVKAWAMTLCTSCIGLGR